MGRVARPLLLLIFHIFSTFGTKVRENLGKFAKEVGRVAKKRTRSSEENTKPCLRHGFGENESTIRFLSTYFLKKSRQKEHDRMNFQNFGTKLLEIHDGVCFLLLC